MSSLVEESLSVSGILLGKTMGRAPELADRFEAESVELADLEVRSRMAGRWRMSSVQMSFAIMPALVYWFAGQSIAHGGGAISIGTVVAFTTLQTRLLFPSLSLLNVGLDMQTSLALFTRIFEYLDQPIDIAERPDAVELDAGRMRGEVRFEDVGFGYDPDAPATIERRRHRRPAGRARRARGGDGRRQDDARLPRRAPVRRDERAHHDRRRRRARPVASPRCRARSASSRRRPTSSTPRSARTCASPSPTPPTRSSRRPRAPRRSTT